MEESLYSKIPQLNPRIDFHYRDNEYIISFKDNKSHLKINSKLFNLIGYVDNKRTLTQIVNEYNNSLEDKINNEFAYELLFEKLGYYNIIENNIENITYYSLIQKNRLRIGYIFYTFSYSLLS